MKVEIFLGDLTPDEQARFPGMFVHIQDRLHKLLHLGRCSFGLIVDLSRIGVRDLHYSYAILDAIGELEDPEPSTPIKQRAKIFQNAPLNGLSHVHYYTADFLAENLDNEIKKSGINWSFLHNREGTPLTSGDLHQIIKNVTHENFEKRSLENRLTGEWIIFSRDKNANYYITIAKHKEGQSRQEGDKIIFERVNHYRIVDEKIRSET